MDAVNGGRLLQAALNYARLGLPVAPLHVYKDGRCSCGDTREHKVGKHPRTPHGVRDATRNLKQIIDWWKRWPDANVMGAMPEGVYVLEIDSAQGVQALASAGVPMDGPRVRTGRGSHVWYRSAEKLPNCPDGVIAPDVGFRGAGEYVLMPPSLHPSGRFYSWDIGFSGPLPETLPEVPGPLLALIRARRPVGGNGRGRWKDALGKVPPGEQALTLLSYCRHMMQVWPVEKWPLIPAVLEVVSRGWPLGDPRWPWGPDDVSRIYWQVIERGVDKDPGPDEPPAPAEVGIRTIPGEWDR